MSTTNIKSFLKTCLKGTITLFLPLALVLLLIDNSFSVAHAQVTFPPVTTFPPTTTYPGTITNPYYPQTTFPYLPPTQTTFPPSVFPPTQSFLPPTSFAVQTGNLSPWFPSIPAIACGGTFFLTIVGDAQDNGNSDSHSHSHGKNTLALQIKSAGGTGLDQNTISGQIFKGSNNIKHNHGQDFRVRGVSNDCQVTTFSR
jgi:hypothetical protein